jgi:DNA-binding phage protein
VTPLATLLREAIDASGLSAREVARRAGLHEPTLLRSLSSGQVSERTLALVCDALGLEVVLLPEGAAQPARDLIDALRKTGPG